MKNWMWHPRKVQYWCISLQFYSNKLTKSWLCFICHNLSFAHGHRFQYGNVFASILAFCLWMQMHFLCDMIRKEWEMLIIFLLLSWFQRSQNLINQELQRSKSKHCMACSSFIFFIGVYNSSIVKTIIVEGAGLCPLQSKTVLLIGSE